MPRSFAFGRDAGKGENGEILPSVAELNLEAIRAADVALGHDIAWLAADCGLSQRQLNKQREHAPIDDEGGPAALGAQWAYRLALFVRAVRRRYGPARAAALCRMVAREGGFDLAMRLPVVELGDVVARVREAAPEVGEGLGAALDPKLPPVERRRQINEAIEALQEVRASVEAEIQSGKQTA